MNKSQLCIALSASMMLVQASLSPAHADNAIWQKLAGTQDKVNTKTAVKPVVVAKASVKAPAKVTNMSAVDAHAMLFLGGKNKAEDTSAPAAALTIHPALSQETAAVTPQAVAGEVGQASAVKPELLAMNDNKAKEAPEVAGNANSKQLLAQLAPDQVVAQIGRA